MKRIKINGDQLSGYTVDIDGSDVTESIEAFNLTMGHGMPPVLNVRTRGPKANVECDAVVQVEDPEYDRGLILEFLGGVDVQALEEAMLNGADMNSGIGSSAVRALQDIATRSWKV
jgi:hypothetical protein